jgi:hypothetical protein
MSECDTRVMVKAVLRFAKITYSRDAVRSFASTRGSARAVKGDRVALASASMKRPTFRSAVALVFALLPACAEASSPDSVDLAPLNSLVGVQGQGTGDAGESFDASVPPSMAPLSYGSPLCNASRGQGCYPDNLASDPTTAQNCQTAPDGGPYDPDGGYADAALACRVTQSDAAPTCAPAGPNQDGASCHLSSDCALGDECVGDPGVCRHYCCSGVESCTASQFCDIRPKAQDPSTQVPVCIPLRPCGLIDEWSDAGKCPAMETCTVARDETGATSCVPIGAAGEGESCATDHCDDGLVCLGLMCFKLCHTAAPKECSTSQTCRAALPLFPNPLVGVCETATDAGF